MKVHANISIDHEIWNACQLKFPKQVSTLIEELLRDLLGATIDAESLKDKNDVVSEISKITVENNKNNANLKILNSKLKEFENSEQKQIEDTKENFTEDYFNLSGNDKQLWLQSLNEDIKKGIIKDNISPVKYYLMKNKMLNSEIQEVKQ